MNNKTVLIAAVLAIATVLAAGLTVLPSSVQEAQANPCGLEATSQENEGEGAGQIGIGIAADERECTIIGNDIDFEED
jgi:hypothetical protein